MKLKLQGKTISPCLYCALSKISQQISPQPPANKSIRPFYRIFVNWLDLEKSWDTYKGNGAIVRQAILLICEAIGMAITYFTQSAKENENLLLLQDFMICLVLRYNLKVKVIHLDNEINRIRTRNWCNNVGILFEPCALDTHVQNSGTDRFGYLIMEKVQAMRLSTNLLYKLGREIIAAATYLYNKTPHTSNNKKVLYQLFHAYVFDKEEISGLRKPPLHYLRAYRCKAYIVIKFKNNS